MPHAYRLTDPQAHKTRARVTRDEAAAALASHGTPDAARQLEQAETATAAGRDRYTIRTKSARIAVEVSAL